MANVLCHPAALARCRATAVFPQSPTVSPAAGVQTEQRNPTRAVPSVRLVRQSSHRAAQQICRAGTLAATDIKLVCLDVDGTMLNSQSELTSATEDAIKACREAGLQVILATGKAPCGPWYESLETRLGSRLAGVFMLGLVLHGSDGKTTYTRALENDFCEDIIAVGKRFKLTTVAYCNERIYIEDSAHSESFRRQGEPEPTAVPDLKEVLKAYDIQKIVFAGEDEYLREVRPRIAEALTSRTPGGRSGSGGGYAQSGEVLTMTMSQSHQLQLLPPGQSKAVGVGRLLKQLGVTPGEMLAIGDSESDTDMLKMAGLSVAMGNASEQVKAVCHETTLSNDEDGAAAAIRKYVLEPRGL